MDIPSVASSSSGYSPVYICMHMMYTCCTTHTGLVQRTCQAIRFCQLRKSSVLRWPKALYLLEAHLHTGTFWHDDVFCQANITSILTSFTWITPQGHHWSVQIQKNWDNDGGQPRVVLGLWSWRIELGIEGVEGFGWSHDGHMMITWWSHDDHYCMTAWRTSIDPLRL